MVKMLRKCCFCMDLKYGFFTFGILTLAGKVSVIVLLNWIITFLDSEVVAKHHYVLPALGLSLGWLIASSFCLYLALRGIMVKRSILLYPYIVIILFELFWAIVVDIILSIIMNPIYLLNIFVHLGINGYIAMCLISLYTKFRSAEKGLIDIGLNKPIIIKKV